MLARLHPERSAGAWEQHQTCAANLGCSAEVVIGDAASQTVLCISDGTLQNLVILWWCILYLRVAVQAGELFVSTSWTGPWFEQGGTE